MVNVRFRTIVSVLAPTGNSRYASMFLASRLLAAGSSAGFAITSFSLAGSSNVGAFAAVAAACAFSGGMAGGWLAQSVLRFHELGDASVIRLLLWCSWRGWAFSLAVLSFGSCVAASVPSASRAGWPGSLLLAMGFATVLALRSVLAGRAMAQSNGYRVLVLEFGQAASVTAPPIVGLLVPAFPFIWVCMMTGILLNLGAIILAGSGRRKSTGSKKAAVDGWPDPGVIENYGLPLGLWIGLSSVYQNADRIMLAWLVSEEAAGEYSVLYDVTGRGLLLPVTALSGAASSAVLRLFSSGFTDRASRANRSLVRVQLILVGGLLLPVIAGASVAVEQLPWFGVHHAVSAVLVYLAAGTWACGDTLQRERMGTGATLPLVTWLAIFAGGGVVLNFAAIPLFGIVGAAAVTFLSAAGYTAVVARDVGVGRRAEISPA